MADLVSLCPNCRARLKVPAGSQSQRIDCPKCKTAFVPKQAPVACPKCKKGLPPGSVFCVGCGFDFRTKSTASAPVFVKEAAPKKRGPPPEPAGEAMDEPTWGEIIALPFNTEVVVAEAIILTMWAFFWGMLFVATATGMFMALGVLGPGTIFSACMLLAGLIRLWMMTSDISLQMVLGLLAGLLGLSALTGKIANLANGNVDPVSVGLFAFMFFVLLGILLRCASFYLGRYFGLVRRAALRTTMSVADRGGLIDLFYGVQIGAVGLTPLLVFWAYDFYLALDSNDFPGGLAAELTALAATLGWAYFYLPMATAVIALRGSANPLVVFRWMLKAFADYVPLLAVYLPFHAAVWAVAAFISNAVEKALIANPGLGVFLAGVNFLVIQLLLNQYSMAVTLASLGLVMRRNEASLKWVKHAKRINAERD